MPDPAAIAEQHDQMLAEAAAILLAGMRKVEALLQAAEDLGEARQGAEALHKLGRGLRQTLALREKLPRDRLSAGHEARERQAREAKARLDLHSARVKAGVERLIWREAETEPAADVLLGAFDTLFDDIALAEGFIDVPVAAHVARLCAALGLKPPSLAGGDDLLPEPAGIDRRPALRSSA